MFICQINHRQTEFGACVSPCHQNSAEDIKSTATAAAPEHIMEVLLLVCFAAFIPPSSSKHNDGPVIGIMAQDTKHSYSGETSYIASSYVKTLESAGARVLPVMIEQSEEQYRKLFHSINGLLLPGGSANISDSGYARAAELFYRLAIEAKHKGDYFPIWGTCLGFEQLAVLTAQKNILVRTDTQHVALPLNFTHEAKGSRMFSNFSPEMMAALNTEPMTINAHKWSVSLQTYYENEKLNKFYKVLSTNNDGTVEFISTFEAYDYPIYGVQWHPEKNPYEWTRDFYPHTPTSIRMSFYFAEFFVSEARKNNHTFESEKAARDLLIHHLCPNYTGETASVFEQKYFFYGSEQKEAEPQTLDVFHSSGGVGTHVNLELVTVAFLAVILRWDM